MFPDELFALNPHLPELLKVFNIAFEVSARWADVLGGDGPTYEVIQVPDGREMHFWLNFYTRSALFEALQVVRRTLHDLGVDELLHFLQLTARLLDVVKQ